MAATAWVVRLARPVPRSVAWIGGPVVFVVLVLFFVYLRFPYDRVAGVLAAGVEGTTGIRLDIGEIGPHLGLLGPGLEARRVTATPAGRSPIEIERLRLRPAWSLSWLTGDPAIHVDLRSPLGAARGAVRLGGAVGFDGVVEDVDLAAPWVQDTLPISGFAGLLSADADLLLRDDVPEGELSLHVGEGSVLLPGSPLAIPFESIDGRLRFGDDHAVTVESLELAGPMLSGRAQGGLGEPGPLRQLDRAALSLAVEVEVKDAMARSALRGTGLRLDRDGKASFEVGGSLSQPRLR